MNLDTTDCPLHRETPFLITGVRNSTFSIARFSGTIKFNGHSYTYIPPQDTLVRNDVLKWLKKKAKK